jgi:photosystem II stability/assembly factor-like uncharacterized protein
MKKLTIFIVLLISLCFLNNSSAQTYGSGWSWLHPRPAGQIIRWFKMIDANLWYAGGDYGMLLKTTNAGANWTTYTGGYQSTLYPGATIFTNILTGYFLNANTGFLGYSSCRGIVKTTNGGVTLDTIQILPTGSASVNSIYFLDAQTGYICGTSTLKAYKTTNGGSNWTQVPNLTALTYYQIYASDTNNIILTSSSGNTYYTTNAGANWTTSNVGTTNTLYGMKFINPTTGYIVGSSGCFRYTTNFGANWSGSSVTTTSSLYNINISGNDLVVSGNMNPDAIFKSTDNGTSWTSLPAVAPAQLSTLFAQAFDKNGNTIVIAGNYGQMNKSTDNGVTWNAMNYSKSLANMVDIYAQNGGANGRIIAIGSDIGAYDQILYSSNGGLNWAVSSYPPQQVLSHLEMVNSNTGYLSGRYGTLAKTTDGGVTWDTTLSGNPALSAYFLNGMDFLDVNTGWIVGGLAGIGGNTKIWKTTNAGVNWTEQTSAYPGPVGVKIQMANATTGYMTCGGATQKTTNGGDNWIQLPGPGYSGLSYTPLKVIDANTVYFGASNTQVYTTTNGGASFDSLSFPVKSGQIFCMDFLNANTGVVGSIIGIIGKTTNHGASWEIMNCGGYTVMSVKMVHQDTIFAVAGNTTGGQVFKYVKSLTGGFFWENQVPSEYKLEQNFPNPFNPSTKIKFAIPKDGNVSLKVFDITGRQVAVLVNGMNLRAGSMTYDFNGTELASGVYFYSLAVDGNLIATKKMILVK